MNNTFGSMGGSPEKQNKKKITLLAIYATVILIVCLLAVLCVVAIVNAVKDKKAEDAAAADLADGSGSVAGFEMSAANASQVYTGYLMLLDEGSAQKTADELVLINSARPEKGADEVSDFKYLYSVNGQQDMYAEETALNAFNKMVTDFYAKSKDDCLYVMNALKPANENYDPEFRLGTTFALGYVDTTTKEKQPIYATHETYKWIYDNCAKYGFIVRYPVADSSTTATGGSTAETANYVSGGSVFRYVGVAHATYIQKQKLTLESYIELLKTKHASPSVALRISGADGQNYAVYYTAYSGDPTPIQLPTQNTWTLSGDNSTGYIVTVNRSVKKATTKN